MPYNQLHRGRYSTEGNCYLLTTATHDRKPLFKEFSLGQLAISAFLNATPQSASWLSWVLMPDHFHGILQLGNVPLSKTMEYCKTASAKSVNKHLKRSGEIWQKGFHDRAIRNESELNTSARYIIANPLRAGLVTSLRGYSFWDSIWL